MNKPTYTEKVHAQRLLKMLKRKDPCGCCPAAKSFDSSKDCTELWNYEKEIPCTADVLAAG